MNVYSLRILPQIKLKFCEMLGIASAFAIQELGERLLRLDQKMDRFDGQIRKLHRRQMVLESAQAKLQEAPKKSPASPKASSGSRKKKKAKAGGNVTPLVGKNLTQEKTPVVLMIQSDNRTQGVVRDFFKGRAKVISVDTVEEIPDGVEKEKLVGIFFERNLLSNEAARDILKDLQTGLPGTRLVGVSNYLTLALAQAAEVEDNFATFLTQPVSAGDLSGIFSEGLDETPEEPSAIAGKD